MTSPSHREYKAGKDGYDNVGMWRKCEKTYAQTWLPCSGIIVKRTLSSSRRTHAILPMDARDAVNSAVCVKNNFHVSWIDNYL